MTLLVAASMFVAVIIFVAYPFLTDTKVASVREQKATQRERVRKKKDDIIANLKDIEMDFRMGKLSQQDYDSLKSEYEQRAVAVFQEMEKLGLDPGAEAKDRDS